MRRRLGMSVIAKRLQRHFAGKRKLGLSRSAHVSNWVTGAHGARARRVVTASRQVLISPPHKVALSCSFIKGPSQPLSPVPVGAEPSQSLIGIWEFPAGAASNQLR